MRYYIKVALGTGNFGGTQVSHICSPYAQMPNVQLPITNYQGNWDLAVYIRFDTEITIYISLSE